MIGEGGVDPAFECVEVVQLGIEGGREGLFAGCFVEASAGRGDRGDAGGGGEQDRQEDLGGDFADGVEAEVGLAEIDGEAIDLSGCQGAGELVHRPLREWKTAHKLFSEEHLSFPCPATL